MRAPQYPKRLIEVDLPIRRISAHARREKSIRQGHISTLHIWWARRPLAACRSVICAALWPDPASETCPESFVTKAREEMLAWTPHERQKLLGEESRVRFEAARKMPELFNDRSELRGALLDFIADFANWDNSAVGEYLATSRVLTQAAHEALGGPLGTRPLIVDAFAGGGSIPIEALRVGGDAFASDLNPIPVLLNKVVLEYIPKFGQRLTDEVRKWGERIKREAEKELAGFYPKDAGDATPMAYLWARTIQCEGPACGAEVPLIRGLWLARKSSRSVALQLVPNKNAKRVDFKIIVKQRGGWVNQDDHKEQITNPTFDGAVKRGSATCPCCGYTTPVARVREQLKIRRGGARDARLFAVVTTRSNEHGRSYRLPTAEDLEAANRAGELLAAKRAAHTGGLTLVPEEKLDIRGIRHTWAMIYGLEGWGDLFTPRQALVLTSLFRILVDASRERSNDEMSAAVQVCLALAIDRQANALTSLSRWHTSGEKIEGVFARQAIPLLWDFAEANPFSGSSGDLNGAIEWVAKVCDANAFLSGTDGQAVAASATQHPLADDSANAFITDPPYYDAVPYAFLSDFFYVWLKRGLGNLHFEFLNEDAVPKDREIVVDRPHELSNSTHDINFYERELTKAFAEGRRVLRPDGIGTIVFASKTTASWEAILKAVVDAGWIITGSWPIDTEMESRIAAAGQARLASSVHLVCRPRENPDGVVRADEVGDWRDLLQELPRRIREWMPRLAEEGVVGADAIFACLGPALEIFSRYSRVEKTSGESVALKEYLEQVWAAVAKQALALVFKDADATGFEPDARLTAMWLWTMNAGAAELDCTDKADEAEEERDAETGGSKAKAGGFTLEYDAARKIAQGLGANIEALTSVVEVSGDKARLLPAAERARHLFGKDESSVPNKARGRKPKQADFFAELKVVDEPAEYLVGGVAPRRGDTALDRVHQAMILFGSGRGEALKRFLVEDGIGREPGFWRLAQALSALYPGATDEKRWVDGVLARKKGLGF